MGETLFPCEEGHLLFEALDSREEFEDHEKYEDKPCKDNSIEISLDSNEISKSIGELGKQNDNRHATPNEDTGSEFSECLAGLMAEEFLYSFIEHVDSDEEDNNLIQLEHTFW